jgi:hypothetical protein
MVPWFPQLHHLLTNKEPNVINHIQWTYNKGGITCEHKERVLRKYEVTEPNDWLKRMETYEVFMCDECWHEYCNGVNGTYDL